MKKWFFLLIFSFILISCEDDPIPYYADIKIFNKTNVSIKMEAFVRKELVKKIEIKSNDIYQSRVIHDTYTFFGVSDLKLDSINIRFGEERTLAIFYKDKPIVYTNSKYLLPPLNSNKVKLKPLDRTYRVYRQIFELEINQADYNLAVPLKK